MMTRKSLVLFVFGLLFVGLLGVAIASQNAENLFRGEWMSLGRGAECTAVYCSAQEGPVVGVYGRDPGNGGITAALTVDGNEGVLLLTDRSGHQTRLTASDLQKLLAVADSNLTTKEK
jgi:hypothetical protein